MSKTGRKVMATTPSLAPPPIAPDPVTTEEPIVPIEPVTDAPESPQEPETPTEPPAEAINPLQTLSGPSLPPPATGEQTGWVQQEYPNMPRDGMVSLVPGPVYVKGVQIVPGVVTLSENIYLARYIANTRAPVYTLKYSRGDRVPLAHVVLVQ